MKYNHYQGMKQKDMTKRLALNKTIHSDFMTKNNSFVEKERRQVSSRIDYANESNPPSKFLMKNQAQKVRIKLN